MLTRMMGCTVAAPSGTHISSRPISRCMRGRCCSRSAVLQSFSLMLTVAAGAGAAAPPGAP
jgi:hypothetical protein